MKKNNLFFAALAFILVTTVSSCKKDDSGLKGNGPVTFEFNNRFGTSPLVLGTTYTTANGESLTPSTFNYFVSNFILVKSDGSQYVVPKDECYHLVRQGVDSTYSLEIENVPAGEYTSLKFTIGVDSLKSTAPIGERTGDLDVAGAASDMYWTWNSGYIFYKLEGTSPQAPYDSMMGMALMFYHMGGYGGLSSSTVNNIRSVSLTAPEAAQVGEGHHPEFHIYADADAVFANPTVITIAAHPGDMSTPFSPTISANYVDMFSINHVHNE
ncbi:MAG: hypothetical protein NTY88_11325 [Bacteroidetes bacterium]|nr:hypothetical protein [Bacteroidota bacterium]